jgi:hypothetical protein
VSEAIVSVVGKKIVALKGRKIPSLGADFSFAST